MREQGRSATHLPVEVAAAVQAGVVGDDGTAAGGRGAAALAAHHSRVVGVQVSTIVDLHAQRFAAGGAYRRRLH